SSRRGTARAPDLRGAARLAERSHVLGRGERGRDRTDSMRRVRVVAPADSRAVLLRVVRLCAARVSPPRRAARALSAGARLARAARVARRLGWALWDNGVVGAVAERLGISRAEASSIDERVPSLSERIASTLRMSTPEFVVPVADTSLTETAEMRIVDVTKRV